MTTAQADTHAARLALLTDRGLSLEAGALLADRLLTRDLERDHRTMCLECVHLHRGHCGNYRRAGVAIRERDAQLPADFVGLLQRCEGYAKPRLPIEATPTLLLQTNCNFRKVNQ